MFGWLGVGGSLASLGLSRHADQESRRQRFVERGGAEGEEHMLRVAGLAGSAGGSRVLSCWALRGCQPVCFAGLMLNALRVGTRVPPYIFKC